ncbi:MAG TPA: SRPBCC family protein [Saprospiraceae bacterium]|nr:SRPBCC family protein [Saprospiraceae bacterium]HRG20824.1 SRPBCC family protein [Saprospiraceae bacterium]
MKYTLSNTINRPMAEVMQKFKDPEGVKHWMEGLTRIEHLSGTPGEVGAKSDFYFLHKNKEMKITETILEQDLPRQIKFGYQSGMGYNEVELRFEELDAHTVKQTSNSYFEMRGLMKVFGFLMQGLFKKQSMKYMDAFKAFVEKG